MKIYYASVLDGSFGGKPLGYFFKRDKAANALYKEVPQARELDQWAWEEARERWYLRVHDRLGLAIKEYPIQ